MEKGIEKHHVTLFPIFNIKNGNKLEADNSKERKEKAGKVILGDFKEGPTLGGSKVTPEKLKVPMEGGMEGERKHSNKEAAAI